MFNFDAKKADFCQSIVLQKSKFKLHQCFTQEFKFSFQLFIIYVYVLFLLVKEIDL